MKKQKRNLHVATDKQQPRTPPNNPERPQGDLQSPEDKQERKERVLTQGASSMVSSIADSIVVKNENIFFLTEPDGDVPLNGAHGLGLYYHDCRFLKGYELKLAGMTPIPLVSTAVNGYQAVFQMTNPDIKMADGKLIPKDSLGIKWERLVDGANSALHDAIELQNFGLQAIEFPISLAFEAGFQDVFAVRQMLDETPGKLQAPHWSDGLLTFIYEGADRLYRCLAIHCLTSPQSTEGTTANFRLTLQPRESKRISVSLSIAESEDPKKINPEPSYRPDLKKIRSDLQASSDEWVARHTQFDSNSILLNNIMDRSLRDLRVLRSSIQGNTFFAAGVPWFVTLFGRDSLVTALQTLAYAPSIANETLRVLASYQGEKLDPWRDEQPGKILHELRIGEFARLGEIPHTPYYGTIDATIPFLILVCRHATWTGDLTVFTDLRSNIERALAWMAEHGDTNGDGYIEYQSSSDKGLANQGWKDSGDAIVNDDGSLATPPISLVEVQGYAYMAKTSLADLFARAGEPDRAKHLRNEAQALRARFNQDFWQEDKGIYALALQAGGRPAAVVSSNPGQALWSGIADAEKAGRTVERLMAADMFNGWGIRTLSEKEKRYNPVGYHLGSVWPHDNSIIAAGFRRYGFDNETLRIFSGIIEAAMHFEHYRLPELFAGFRREDYKVPVRYPVACHPQAWAAVTVPYLIETLLGFAPEAFENRLRIIRPMLPDFLNYIEVRGLRVGKATADLRFERTAKGTDVQILKVNGQLDVTVES